MLELVMSGRSVSIGLLGCVHSSAAAPDAPRLATYPSNVATVSDRTKLTPIDSPIRTRRDPFTASFQMRRMTKMSDVFVSLGPRGPSVLSRTTISRIGSGVALGAPCGASGQAQKIITQRTQTVELLGLVVRPMVARFPGLPAVDACQSFATPQGAGAPQRDADFENHFVDVLGRELHNPGGDLAAHCDVSLRLGLLLQRAVGRLEVAVQRSDRFLNFRHHCLNRLKFIGKCFEEYRALHRAPLAAVGHRVSRS